MVDPKENKNETQLTLFNASINVKMDKLGKPIDKLIDACSRGTGIAYLPRHIKKLALASKYVGKKLDLSGQEIKELFGASFLLTYGKQNRQHENIQSITQKAIDILPDTVEDKPVDEDWIAHFFEDCKNVSNEQMQILWGRLLAGEISKPGSFSGRTLDFIKSMSTEEAEIFTSFCRFVLIHHEESFPFRIEFDDIRDYLKKNVNDYKYWQHLDDIGLTHSGICSSDDKFMSRLHIDYFDREFIMLPSDETGKRLKPLFCYHRFALIGNELYKIANPKPDYEYIDLFIETSKKEGFKIEIVT